MTKIFAMTKILQCHAIWNLVTITNQVWLFARNQLKERNMEKKCRRLALAENAIA